MYNVTENSNGIRQEVNFMNDKSQTEKTAFGMSEEKFQQMLEEQERSETFEDKALEQFVRKPEESNLYDKFISITHFFLLFFLLCVICACSIILIFSLHYLCNFSHLFLLFHISLC